VGGHKGFSLILPCEGVSHDPLKVEPSMSSVNQYLRLEPLIADSPQAMATRNVRAMNQKVRSMLFWGLAGLLLFVCKRQLNHTPPYIGRGLMELVPP